MSNCPAIVAKKHLLGPADSCRCSTDAGKGSMETAIVNASNSDLAKLMLKLEDRKR